MRSTSPLCKRSYNWLRFRTGSLPCPRPSPSDEVRLGTRRAAAEVALDNGPICAFLSPTRRRSTSACSSTSLPWSGSARSDASMLCTRYAALQERRPRTGRTAITFRFGDLEASTQDLDVLHQAGNAGFAPHIHAPYCVKSCAMPKKSSSLVMRRSIVDAGRMTVIPGERLRSCKRTPAPAAGEHSFIRRVGAASTSSKRVVKGWRSGSACSASRGK